MITSRIRFGQLAVIVLVVLLLFACGHGQRAAFAPQLGSFNEPATPIAQPEVTWPAGLPADALQPWEETDGSGRIASSINLDSQFVPGVERFSDAGEIADLGEAASFASGAPGAEAVSYAIYRIPLGTDQPGTIAADVNLHGSGAYWLGVADYSANTWRWHGPFAAPHVRVTLPHYEYTSALGNLFIAVVAYDGAAFDLVGLGINARDDADSTAPSIPEAPTLTPVAGGLHVRWLQVDEEDVAGYRVYTNGEEALNYVEGGTSVVIPATGEAEITLTAIDLSGNESDPSEASTDSPLAGDIPAIELTASAASGGRNAVIELSASGADTYDWDVDGDGNYDITGDTAGTATASTSNLGIIRPALRGHTADGGFSLSAVSLIIAGNSRPVAAAYADPSSGYAPLDVSFTGEGEDDDGTIDAYAWDFDGDGVYDSASQNPPPHQYSTPGLYNAKFRVTDDEGAWDVDTVGVQVLPAQPPDNVPPMADLQADVTSGNAPLTVSFDAAGSDDSDGSIVEYAWDLDGDGAYDKFTDDPTYAHTYTSAGSPEVKLRVEDDDGARATDTITITVNVVGNTAPTADISATPASGDAPLSVDFDASLSDDPNGTIVRYDYDFDNDGIWEAYDSADMVSWIYASPGDYDAKVRVTDDAGAQATDTVTVNVSAPGNSDPTANIGADPTSGNTPLTVDFDATGSDDSDGDIVRYDWDFDGDGNYEIYDGSDTPSWTYNSAGDFDARVRVTDDDGAQDNDYTTISVSVPGNADPTANLSPASSSGNVPKTVSFDASGSSDSDGTIVLYEWDFDGNGNYDGYGTDTTVDHTYTIAGDYTARVRVTDDDGAQDTGTCDVSVNAYPTAVLEPNVYEGDASLEVVFDFSSSSDPDGSITNYRFDATSDGSWEYNGTNTSYTHNFGSADYHAAKLRVTDDDGAYSEVQVTITVHGWRKRTVDNSVSYIGEYSSLAIVNGNPAISYYNSTGSSLRYVRATTPEGDEWGTPITVDNSGSVGEYTSLAVVNGYPAISYSDDTNYDLKYVRATDAAGSAWGTPNTVASTGYCGHCTSLAVVNGNPAIGYLDQDDYDPMFVRATDANGDTWGTPISADTTANQCGADISLKVVDGYPAMSYWQWSTADLKYVRATDTNGTAWGTPVTPDSAGSVGQCTSLQVVNGYPAISYYDYGNDDLKYVRATDSTGSSWGTPLVLHSGGNAGEYSSLLVMNGYPTVVYIRYGLGLLYKQALDASGDTWGTYVVIDSSSSGSAGINCSLAIVGGYPAVSYYSTEGYSLKFTRLY